MIPGNHGATGLLCSDHDHATKRDSSQPPPPAPTGASEARHVPAGSVSCHLLLLRSSAMPAGVLGKDLPFHLLTVSGEAKVTLLPSLTAGPHSNKQPAESQK